MAHLRKEITWIENDKGCWLCNSHATDRDGYPNCKRNGRAERISREHYRLYKGEIPVNHVVRHTCDTPACINPEHLLLGTHADNVADRVSRNRSAKGIISGRSKLTEQQVISIYSNKTDKCTILASYYKVDNKTIRNIQQRKNWISVIDTYLATL